jgi:hypothetical protein
MRAVYLVGGLALFREIGVGRDGSSLLQSVQVLTGVNGRWAAQTAKRNPVSLRLDISGSKHFCVLGAAVNPSLRLEPAGNQQAEHERFGRGALSDS